MYLHTQQIHSEISVLISFFVIYTDSHSMTNSNVVSNQQQSPQIQRDSPVHDANQGRNSRKQKGWKTVSSVSSLLSFEYSDPSHRNRNNNGNYNGGKTSSIDDLANYGFGFEDYTFNDIEAITASNISHSSIKNVQKLTRNSKYRNSADGAAETRFKGKARASSSTNNHNNHNHAIPGSYNDKYIQNQQRLMKKRRSKYSITDIFACNSSFILDHEYNEDDICNLILNNSTQTQTKIKFLKSIWPHILRVNTRVLDASKFRCPICLDENISIGRITECGHCFCGTCLLHHLFTSTQSEHDQRIFPEV